MTTGTRRLLLARIRILGVPNGTPYAAYYRAFRLAVSGVTGSERAMVPGLGLVQEIVRLSLNERFPQLMSSLYLGHLATRPQPFDSIYATWLALGTLANNKTPAINGTRHRRLLLAQGHSTSQTSYNRQLK